MSVEFDEAINTEAIGNVSSISIAPYPLTILCSIKTTSNTAATQRNMIMAGPNTMLVSIYVNGTPDITCQARDEAAVLRSSLDLVSNLTLNQWYTVALVMEDATTFSTYLDGSQIQGNASWASPFDLGVSPSNLSGINIGAWGTSQRSDSRMANVAVWSAALSRDECESLTSGVSPLMFPTNLEFYWEGMNDTLKVSVDSLATLQQIDGLDSATLVLDDNPKMIFAE